MKDIINGKVYNPELVVKPRHISAPYSNAITDCMGLEDQINELRKQRLLEDFPSDEPLFTNATFVYGNEHRVVLDACGRRIYIDFNNKARYTGPTIRDIIFQDDTTIVRWQDGSKTMVKCTADDEFDKEKGVALCYMKKILGDWEYKKMLKEANATNRSIGKRKAKKKKKNKEIELEADANAMRGALMLLGKDVLKGIDEAIKDYKRAISDEIKKLDEIPEEDKVGNLNGFVSSATAEPSSGGKGGCSDDGK